MECYLYTFSKKQNSTKIPTNGTLFDINFLSPTDMLNPNIELILDHTPIITHIFGVLIAIILFLTGHGTPGAGLLRCLLTLWQAGGLK